MIDITKLGKEIENSGVKISGDVVLTAIIKAEAMDRQTKAMENIGQALFAISKSLDPLDLS